MAEHRAESIIGLSCLLACFFFNWGIWTSKLSHREVIKRNDYVLLMPGHSVLPASLSAACSV